MICLTPCLSTHSPSGIDVEVGLSEPGPGPRRHNPSGNVGGGLWLAPMDLESLSSNSDVLHKICFRVHDR